MGFTGCMVEGQIAERGRCSFAELPALKLSPTDDFSLLIIYAAAKGKPQAIALNRALVKMSLYDFFCNACRSDRGGDFFREVRD